PGVCAWGRAGAAAPAAAALDPEARDRRDQARRGAADGRGVGVERLLLDGLGQLLVGEIDGGSFFTQGDHGDRSGLAGGTGRAADADRSLLVAADDLQLDRQAARREDLGQRVGVGECATRGLDEEVALADPGSSSRAVVLDPTDEQAIT